MNNKAPSVVPPKVEPPMGHCCCDSRQYDRLTTTGWALHFRPPTISIMSVLMYTEQPQSQGHGQGKHTCRKQTSDRIIKCHDWFSLLCARLVYCVGGVVPDCVGFCGELSVVLVREQSWDWGNDTMQMLWSGFLVCDVFVLFFHCTAQCKNTPLQLKILPWKCYLYKP